MIPLIFLAALLWFGYSLKKQQGTPTAGSAVSPGNRRDVHAQPISYQAAQGFAQGNKQSPGHNNRYTEGNRAIAQKQSKRTRGVAGNAGTERVLADLADRIASTFDPQWKMRYMNAYHRMSLQLDVDNGRDPSASLNVDRTSQEVNDDTGEASGFTRTQITYQDRFRRGRPRVGMGPNPHRPLDQADPGDTTALQTTLNPDGFKSIIYPAADHDRDGIKKPWPGLRIVNLEQDYWNKSGRPYNQVGATQSDMPAHKGWNWSGIIPKRGKHGAYPSQRALPSRSNPHDDSVDSGQGTG